MDRRTFVAATALGAYAAHAQDAQGLPEGNLSIYAGFPAGSSVDALARAIAEHARSALGRPVLVLNQPGATGMISLGQLKRAPADGSTIGLVPVTSGLVAPLFRSKPDFNLVADFEPVVMIGHYALAFSVANRLGVEDWKGFMQWARAHPSELFYGHGGTGSMAHLVGAQVAGATGLKLQDVPFKSDGESLMSVLGGQTQTALSSTVAVHTHYKAGKVRTLAVTSRERVPQMPDVPTLVELGYPAAVAEPWMALFAPRGTPPRAIATWNRIVNTALADAGFRQSLANQGYVVAGGPPDALRTTVAADAAKYRKVMESAGLKPVD